MVRSASAINGWQSTGYALKSSIATGRARAFRQAVRALALSARSDDDPFRVDLAGDACRSTSTVRNQDGFALAGHVTGELELACSRCLEPFTLPVDVGFRPALSAAHRERRRRRARSRRGRSGDGVLRRRADRPRAVDHGAVLAGAADEAAVQGGLQGAVPAVRDEPEYRLVRLQPDWEDPTARGAESAEAQPSNRTLYYSTFHF